MASASDIAEVRRNTHESTDHNYSDTEISDIIDAEGVAGAIAKIWREKAARYAEMVNVSESGASHSYSDLHRAALRMAEDWDKKVPPPVEVTLAGRTRVKKIVRS